MPENDYDPKTAIYTPQQVGTYTLNAVRKTSADARAALGVRFPIPGVGTGDSPYFPPVMPGQLCAIVAQTSNGKSALLHHVEHEAARELDERGATDSIIVHVSVEEMVEEQGYLELARIANEEGGKEDAGDLARGTVQDWGLLEQAAIKVGRIPIFRIGESLARAEDMPNLYISNMVKSIRTLVEGKVLDYRPKVAGLFFDYLQAFPIDPEIKQSSHDQQRRLQVRSDIYRLRQAAAYFYCPVWVAVQAKQHLDGANPPIMLPGVYDGEESSSIAQRCDRVITMWMPKTTHPVGSTIQTARGAYTVRDNGVWIKIAKQRGRLPAGKIWQCAIDYKTNRFLQETQER